MTATRQPVASSVLALAPVADLADVSTTVLKNKFSDVARLASREPLAITRHNRREFVILTAEQYEEIQKSRQVPLDSLTAEFDEMVAKMNTREDRAARESFFAASAVQPSTSVKKPAKPRTHAG